MYIDFHSHIIPGIDDGAKTAEDSIVLLEDCYKKGIGTVVLTPHYYPKGQETLQPFIQKRDEAYKMLLDACAAYDKPLPELRLGCEINLRADVSEYEGIENLCIEGTEYIMIEMPYTPWNENLFDWIYGLKLRGLKPVIAHIDRYLDFPQKLLKSLFDLDVCYQVNADAFLNFAVKKEIAKMFTMGLVHILGSDVHNMDERKNNMDEALLVLKSQFGEDYVKFLSENAENMINNKPPHKHSHKMLGKVSTWGLWRNKKNK